MQISDLIEHELLSYAQEPQDNPARLDFSRYTIWLGEKDYPARTPQLWNAAYRKFSLAAGNVALVGDPARIPEIFEVFRCDPKFLGSNTGIGFKDEALGWLDELGQIEKAIGAVNFILKTEEGKLRGISTDGVGYRQSLEAVFSERGGKLEGKKILVLGAGGAGNAIAFALAESANEVIILNRTPGKAAALAKRINDFFGKPRAYGGGREEIPSRVLEVQAVVAAIDDPHSPLEQYVAFGEVELPASEENLRKNIESGRRILGQLNREVIISDIMLRKEPTRTLAEAGKMGFKVLDGTGMVVNQAVEAFWILHGRELAAKNINKEEVKQVMKSAAWI